MKSNKKMQFLRRVIAGNLKEIKELSRGTEWNRRTNSSKPPASREIQHQSISPFPKQSKNFGGLFLTVHLYKP